MIKVKIGFAMIFALTITFILLSYTIFQASSQQLTAFKYFVPPNQEETQEAKPHDFSNSFAAKLRDLSKPNSSMTENNQKNY